VSSGRPLRVVVTRPAAQAAAWVQQLRGRGIDAEALPLIEIAPVDDSSSLVDAWHAIARHRLVVFVSANAVERFFAARPDGVAWPDDVAAGAPGPGTADALPNHNFRLSVSEPMSSAIALYTPVASRRTGTMRR